MTKKPRKKKHSAMKRLTLTSKYVMKNVAIVFTLNQKATFVDLKTKRIIPAERAMITAAKDITHNWRVYVSVMLENSLGEQYIKTDDCTPERACYQEDMLDHLNEHHIKLINSTKVMDRVNSGWVAIPSGKELTEKEIAELLEVLPCWGEFERGDIKTETDTARERAEMIRLLEVA